MAPQVKGHINHFVQMGEGFGLSVSSGSNHAFFHVSAVTCVLTWLKRRALALSMWIEGILPVELALHVNRTADMDCKVS